MRGRYEPELTDAKFRASMSSAAVAAGVHNKISGPGARLSVSRIVDSIEGVFRANVATSKKNEDKKKNNEDKEKKTKIRKK